MGDNLPARTPGRDAEGATRVAVFIPCLVDAFSPEAGRATVAVLRRLGLGVDVPLAQTCCGQMHVNAGYQRQALSLVRNHVAAFAGYEAVVAPSGSCVASVRHQHSSVALRVGDSHLAEKATVVARRTYKLSEFLVDVMGVTDVGAYYPHRVTHHSWARPPGCHRR